VPSITSDYLNGVRVSAPGGNSHLLTSHAFTQVFIDVTMICNKAQDCVVNR